MEYFLEKIARLIYKSHQNDLGDICIVLPNKRARLFLKKYISNELSKPTIAPDFYSIEEFIEKISGLEVIDPIHQLFFLYDIHRNIEKDNSNSFDDFLQLGNMMLNDFNDIDSYLVNAESLFGFLSESKAISIWNLDQQPLTEFEKNYLDFFKSLFQYYNLFKEKLLRSKQAYRGMSYREVAENMKEVIKYLQWKKVIFVGFNALSSAEETIITMLLKEEKAEIFWDSDEYYIKNNSQEAGTFLRNYYRSWNLKSINWIENYISETKKKIQIIGVPMNISQVKYAGKILSSYTEIGNKDALILSDENLLLPVLNSLPPNVDHFNVTMGYPFHLTPAFSIAYYWLSMVDNIIRTKNVSHASTHVIHKKDILKVLQHPYLKYLITGDTSSELTKIIGNLSKSYKFFYTYNEISSLFKVSDKLKEFNSFFDINTKSDPILIFNRLTIIIDKLQNRIQKLLENAEPNIPLQLDYEYLLTLSDIVQKISRYTESSGIIISFKALKSIFLRIAQVHSIPFFGEPLKGLQIMGMLETRTLDFDRIIMLSVNEGNIPSSGFQSSLIPLDIRKKFKLPTQKDKNAIYAYHFYRLLQRAKDIVFIYNTESNELGGGDRSRYLHQIEKELSQTNKEIDLEMQFVAFPLSKSNTEISITIEKDKDVNKLILKKAIKGFSPTSISSFVYCPLQFYFRYILGIDANEEAEESIDAAILGNIVHNALYNLFLPLKEKVLNTVLIDFKENQIHKALQEALKLHFKEGDISYGKNYLIYNVAFTIIERLIKQEKLELKSDLLNKTIIKLEETVEKKLQIHVKESIVLVNIKGKVDRIDRINNIDTIIDYKTGRTEEYELKLKSWDEVLVDRKKSKALQLLIYSWLYSEQNHSDIKAGILSLRKISSGIIYLQYPDKNNIFTAEIKSETELIITEVLHDILNTEIPFSQTSDYDKCEICSFKSVCNR